ncbi:hypothetical protein MHYP_G00109010 [Metynnis hypsauchen]
MWAVICSEKRQGDGDGKRKMRDSSTLDFTMRRELKALDSSLPKLPPISTKPMERKPLDLAAQASSILPPIKGCCPAPAQAMKGDLHFLVTPVQQHEDDQCELEKLSSASVSETGSNHSLDESLDNTLSVGVNTQA